MDWVEKRAQEERKLQSEAPQFWAIFKLRCEEAVKSLKTHYATPRQITSAASDYAVQVFIDGKEHRASFDKEAYAIVIDRITYQLVIGEDGTLYAQHGKERFTPDELCQKFLEPLFFPSSRARPQLLPEQ